MNNEIGTGVQITISLMVISVMIFILVTITVISQSFGRDAVQTVADINEGAYAAELVAAESRGALPAAAVYALLVKDSNSSAVRNLSGSAYGRSISSPKDLIPLFHKKIRIDLQVTNPSAVNAVQVSKTYDVVIMEE